MANHSNNGRGRPGRTGRRAGTPAFTEPEVRRWPHPVEGTAPSPPRQAASARPAVSAWQAAPAPQTDPALYYIHCALSYQNQLLADIKVLLEQMAADSAPTASEGTPGTAD